MSYSILLVGKDKEKLKAAVREQQAKDAGNPHSGVPAWVADRLCAEIDRVRIYSYVGRSYGLRVEASGSFHEQGSSDVMKIDPIQLTE